MERTGEVQELKFARGAWGSPGPPRSGNTSLESKQACDGSRGANLRGFWGDLPARAWAGAVSMPFCPGGESRVAPRATPVRSAAQSQVSRKLRTLSALRRKGPYWDRLLISVPQVPTPDFRVTPLGLPPGRKPPQALLAAREPGRRLAGPPTRDADGTESLGAGLADCSNTPAYLRATMSQS